MDDVPRVLVEQALTTLGVTEVAPLRGGAQKAVSLVDRDGERLVLKVISIGASNPDSIKRAEREVELLSAISSPYVVAVASELIELGNPPTGAAWLEEFLDGDDLTPSLQTGPWTWNETAMMARDVAKGLGAAHVKRVVHRDLSPNNIRRLSNGTYKVMDFGFARHTLRSGLTIAGQPGTPGFASPEHLHNFSGAPTAASDVFCVGILVYTALSGQVPIPYAGDDADYAIRLINARIVDIAEHRPDLTDRQCALIRKCLHPQPARRYLNGNRLAQAVEELM
ncbi:serine/threonine-protein kinase [Streptomyces sp. NPDC048481]|uniref:serine/threonine-protein kinase n=1 Tax=Streptomyces sp. NPDC048481 TaxID=3365557 RepID=UPI00370F9187